MSSPQATPSFLIGAGGWTVTAHRPGLAPVDVTFVRGVPTVISEWSMQDPFGPAAASLTFPAVTLYDEIGRLERDETGDLVDSELAWLAHEVNFDITWTGPVPPGYPQDRWVWEGFSMSLEYSDVGITVQLVGALFQLDHFLAKPEYALQPIPYETAIRRQFLDKPSLRLSTMRFEWPEWWTKVYNPVADQQGQLIPTGVQNYEKWSGLVTRDTGSFDPVLTGYIQTLLSSWYTERGRFTLSLLPGRRPLLHHRDIPTVRQPTMIDINPLQPGIKVSLVEDWSQSANVFYGQAKGLNGEAYSGMQVLGDGLATIYRPLAALPTVDPVLGPGPVDATYPGTALERNPALNLGRMRKESKLDVQSGLQADEAIELGRNHLEHFAHPGFTGTITLDSDVVFNGAPMHRSLVLPGMTVHLLHFKGYAYGVLLHVVETSWSGTTMTLTVDSKYRDKLTIDEVQVRGRDALSVPRMLINGRYSPTLPDQLFPWNYSEGSGYIPSAPGASALPLFRGMPYDIEFPWTEWTTTHSPSDPAWRNSYIAIGGRDTNADGNWAERIRNADGRAQGPSGRFGIPIRMSQAGTIRLLQIAAYDAAGNVLAVPFHVSLYYQPGVNVDSMPKIPVLHGGTAAAGGYPTGQHYPFFPQAWEQYRIDGTQVGTEVPVAVRSAGLIQGWGNQLVPAGYWPGTKLDADAPTGLLVDEEPWTYDLIGQTPHIGQYQINDLGVYAGFVYAMIYCDGQAFGQEVFFMGRMYRQEPGTMA